MKEKFLKIRAKILIEGVEIMKPIYAFLFQRDKKPWKQTIASLKQYPQKSLGYSLAVFLEDHGFDLVPLYENHDVFHVLLDYKPTVEEEVAMQFFLIGNGKWSTYTWFTVLISPILLPEYLYLFKKAYYRGKKSLPISKWDFQHLLQEPLDVLKEQLEKKPLVKQAAPFILF